LQHSNECKNANHRNLQGKAENFCAHVERAACRLFNSLHPLAEHGDTLSLDAELAKERIPERLRFGALGRFFRPLPRNR
jgi:hypothetical protein